MRNLIFLFVLVCTTSVIQAQNENISKGTWMAGGSVSFSNTTQTLGNNSTTNTNFTLEPQAGYFFSSRFALTFGTSFSTSTFAAGRSSGFSIQPGARFYLHKGFFASAQVGIGHVKTSITDPASSDYINIISFEGGTGYSIFLNKYVAIEPALVYRVTNFDQNGTSSSFTGSNREFNFSVGFRIFL
ncbi:hypothetical protein BKI52_25025 [marine bacterium AO1-C]|nr:hypothetical protein BKI52_25025 [marine bacterium AO1-C]